VSPYIRTCRACGHTKPVGRFRGGDSVCRECRSVEGRRRRRRPEARRRARDARLRRRYGIGLADVEAMARSQGWRCAACKGPGPLVVDHDHVTGAVRALLCHGCNTAIGLLGEDPARAVAVAEYLRRYAEDTET